MPIDQLGEPASRRTVLRGAAGLGAAGLAATALTGFAGPALASAKSEAGPDAAGHDAAEHDAGHPVVAHVRDASTGHVEVYSGTSQVHLRDKDLAERIVRASRKQVR